MRYATKNIAIIGANGALGHAFIYAYAQQNHTIYAFSRAPVQNPVDGVIYHMMDYLDETSIAHAVQHSTKAGMLDMVIVATGLLHMDTILPEKSIKHISAHNMQSLFMANTVVPSLLAKHFLPYLRRHSRAIFTALSARVGSISDNRLGGWYAYRTSKAGLNMMIKGLSIEMSRTHPQAIVVGLHPGTVDSNLSKPFQANVPMGKLFTPSQSAQYLISVLDGLNPIDTGRCFAWDGTEVYP